MSFTRSGVTAENTGVSLLDQAEAAGLQPEFGCRMGICFSCTAVKRSGRTRTCAPVIPTTPGAVDPTVHLGAGRDVEIDV